ncbi:uncharacterized protein [Littorina saxatilis]|uniref:uncharacterized protein n=1 Tax=Littorina saxatilis TaxID=31220 RepID=UPI0038B606D5
MEDITNVQKRKYYKDSEEAVKRRNVGRVQRKAEGKIQFSGEKDEIDLIHSQVRKIKTFLGEGNPNTVTNKQLVDTILRFFIDKNIELDPPAPTDAPVLGHFADTSFSLVSGVDSSDEQLFVCAQSSLDKFCERVYHHSVQCGCSLVRTNMKMLGHVGLFTFACDNDHKIDWPSSPYLGVKYLVNCKMIHGYCVSGIKLNQYQRIVEAAGIGKLGDDYVSNVFSVYKDCVARQVSDSTYDALLEELVLYEDGGISILTDARHGTRKNSRYSDIVCLGAQSHKVLHVSVVSRTDEPCAQKHELIGTKRVYDYLDGQEDGSVHIRVHCHDRNATVNKWVRDNRPDTTSTNDTWHAAKNVAKEVRTVCTGPRYQEGKTWHPELSDKAASIKTHMYWSMKNCEDDPTKLQAMIINIIQHYKGNHHDCHTTSRCKTDPQYEPSKLPITDPKAELLLRQALERTVIFKNPLDYIHCMDTYFVESFNNTMLQYHDKRTDGSLSLESYTLRTHMSILDWNENINSRIVTSLREIQDARNPRRVSARRNLKRKCFDFWTMLWHDYASAILQQ